MADTPLPATNRFTITIDGYDIATFSELVGIHAEVEPVPYLESPDKEVLYNTLPGRSKPPIVTLRRGASTGMELWSWFEAVRRGEMQVARKSCSLTFYSVEGKAVAQYWLENAWPSKLDIAPMKAGASQVMFETVTLTCEHMQRVAV